MIEAELDRQLMITVDNKAGTLADITHVIASSGINLVATCAYAVDNRGFIMFVSENNDKAAKVLRDKGYEVRPEEVVLVSVENKPGVLEEVTKTISDVGIDLTLLYGSVDKTGQRTRLVLISEDNTAVLLAIKAKNSPES